MRVAYEIETFPIRMIVSRYGSIAQKCWGENEQMPTRFYRAVGNNASSACQLYWREAISHIATIEKSPSRVARVTQGDVVLRFSENGVPGLLKR